MIGLPARLSAFYFAYFVYNGAFLAYFPLYLAWRGFDAAQIGWVLALPQLARIAAPSAWAAVADGTGERRLLVVLSCAAAAACFAALPFVRSFPGVAALVGATSLVSTGGLPLVEALTLDSLAEQPARYGPIRLWGSIGFIAAVLGTGAWLDHGALPSLPWPLLAFALATFVIATAFPTGPAPKPQGRVSLRLSPAAIALIGGGFFMAAAHGTLYAFLTLHLQRLGYSTLTVGALWTLGVLAEIAVFVCLPAIFKRFSLSAILIASFACAVGRFLALGWLADVFWLLIGAQLLHAATFGTFHAASVAAVRRVFSPEAQGRGQALFSSLGYGAGGAAGALAAGAIWQAAGAGLAFTFSAFSALAGLLLACALRRHRI